MSQNDTPRQVFEALIRSKGRSNLTRLGDGYKNGNVQTKWRYFLLGWTLCQSNSSN